MGCIDSTKYFFLCIKLFLELEDSIGAEKSQSGALILKYVDQTRQYNILRSYYMILIKKSEILKDIMKYGASKFFPKARCIGHALLLAHHLDMTLKKVSAFWKSQLWLVNNYILRGVCLLKGPFIREDISQQLIRKVYNKVSQKM